MRCRILKAQADLKYDPGQAKCNRNAQGARDDRSPAWTEKSRDVRDGAA